MTADERGLVVRAGVGLDLAQRLLAGARAERAARGGQRARAHGPQRAHAAHRPPPVRKSSAAVAYTTAQSRTSRRVAWSSTPADRVGWGP